MSIAPLTCQAPFATLAADAEARKIKPAVRLAAKPARPHGGKHGAKGYDRKKAKAQWRLESLG